MRMFLVRCTSTVRESAAVRPGRYEAVSTILSRWMPHPFGERLVSKCEMHRAIEALLNEDQVSFKLPSFFLLDPWRTAQSQSTRSALFCARYYPLCMRLLASYEPGCGARNLHLIPAQQYSSLCLPLVRPKPICYPPLVITKFPSALTQAHYSHNSS